MGDGHDQQLVSFQDVDEPEPGMLYTDRLGPWFMSDGTEVIPVGTEAVEAAVELVVGEFCLRSNEAAIDSRTVEVSFPALTALIQRDWSRVVEGELPDRGLLIAYESSAAAVGRLAEDLICNLTLDQIAADLWGDRAVVAAVADAASHGRLLIPATGVRSDDLCVLVDDKCVALIESKCTHGSWGSLRRPGRKGTRQLAATAAENPQVRSGAILAASLADHQIGFVMFDSGQLADGTALTTWASLHRDWTGRHTV